MPMSSVSCLKCCHPRFEISLRIDRRFVASLVRLYLFFKSLFSFSAIPKIEEEAAEYPSIQPQRFQCTINLLYKRLELSYILEISRINRFILPRIASRLGDISTACEGQTL
jgi:hypothetical protein